MPSARFLLGMLLLAIAGSGYLAARLTGLERDNAHLRNALHIQTQTARRLRSARAGLLDAMSRVPVDSGGLQGTDYVSGDTVNLSAAPDGVYYVIHPDCPACALNLPFLRQASKRFPGWVLGIAPVGREQLAEYSQRHALNFPLLGDPKGRIVDLLPRNVTPITAIVVDGSLMSLIPGKLAEEDEEVILSLLRDLMSDSTVAHQ